jgi:hypothetical protein
MPRLICVAPVEGREEMIDVLEHPIDGRLKGWGSIWTYDAFTCKMIMDGVIYDTGEEVAQTSKSVGPESIMQQRRVSKTRPRMRIHNPPTVK